MDAQEPWDILDEDGEEDPVGEDEVGLIFPIHAQ